MTPLYPTLFLSMSIPAFALQVEGLDQHPRPDWARPWVNLNGTWRFDFDPDDVGIGERWYEAHQFSGTIQVPYPWQSALSGVRDVDYQGAAWYERELVVPGDLPGSRVFLVFGAVDWHATVWVNGKKMTEHEGGYAPFEVELTHAAQRGETVRVTLRAYDVTDPETPNGKQTGWYTRNGGIWQTVYLEGRGDAYVRRAHITPDVDNEKADFDLVVEIPRPGKYELFVAVGDQGEGGLPSLSKDFAEAGAQPVSFSRPIREPKLWTPDNPNLYDVELKFGPAGGGEYDTVHTYFGMRKISGGTYAGSDHEYILLNNKPIFLRGALHQSFNPEGVYTHPDDDFIRRDYEKAKEFGLNFLRIHIKVDEPRALYWADRLGVMLMCDMPNFQRKTPRAEKFWEETLRAAIARDFNHPSVIAWCNFNETWGIGDGGYGRETQAWVRDMYLLAKELDPTRLVEDNSPCRYDHTATDINSWHFYVDRYERARDHVADVVENTFPGSEFNYADGWRQDTAPLINSEYGGVGAGSGDRDISWVFLFLTNLLRKYDKVCGYVYTELSDIEWEHNGFMNYDRSDKDYHYPADIAVPDLQGEEFPVLDCPPYQQVQAGTRVRIPVLLSHWSERENLMLRMFAEGTTVEGNPWSLFIPTQERPVTAKPYAVTSQGTFDIDLPDANGLLNVVAEVLHDGKRCAANYCVLHVRGGSMWGEPNLYAISFPVESFSEYQLSGETFFLPDRPGKVFGHGAGFIEYDLRLPGDLKADDVVGCRLVIEVGAKADAERLDWPARRKPADCPQTDGRTWPTDVFVSLKGCSKRTGLTIDNDFADAAGVLSHVAYYHHGSRGVTVVLPFSDEELRFIKNAPDTDAVITLRFEVCEDAENVGGLALYGATMGAYPADPTLVFTLAPDAAKPKAPAGPIGTGTQIVTLIPCGPEGHTWRYTLESPPENWQEPDFDDSAWGQGKGGFGREGTPGARIGTPWLTSDIWLRTRVDLPPDFGGNPVFIDLHHDEDVEVYVNGGLLLRRTGHATAYQKDRLSEEDLALFRPGQTNLVAVHCHQTAGGQFVDLGLSPAR